MTKHQRGIGNSRSRVILSRNSTLGFSTKDASQDQRQRGHAVSGKQTKHFDMSFDLKSFKEVKQEDGTEEYEFEGYASTFGNIDRGRDIVMPGAFEKPIREFNMGAKRIPILWQHDMYRPIGQIRSLQEDQKGLFIKGTMPKGMTFVSGEVAPLLQSQVLNSMSIGYFTDRSEFDEAEGVRKIIEADLLEVSIVTFPMNEEAMITSVKSDDLAEMSNRALETALRAGTPFSKSAALQIMKYIKAGRRSESDGALQQADEKQAEGASNTQLLKDILELQRKK